MLSMAAHNIPANLRIEDQLVLCCARATFTPNRTARVCRMLEQHSLNWEHVLRRADQHKVLPLLYWRLKRIAPDRIPEPILARLQASFQANSWRSLFLTDECLRILQMFSQNGIAAVPLKGPVLAYSLYGNPALRFFEDLDVLICEQHRQQATAILCAVGFTVFGKGRNSYHSGFVAPDHSWLLELHWGLTVPELTTISVTDLLQRSKVAMFAGTPIRQLELADQIVFLCLHGAKHGWNQLRWIGDVAEFVCQNKEIDWEHILLAATCLGHERIVLLGLYLASSLMEAPLPDLVVQRMYAVPIIQDMAQRIYANLFQDDTIAESQVAPNNINIQSLDSSYARVHLVLRQLIRDLQPKDKDYQLLQLPRCLAFLYYPLRLLRLLWVYRILVFKRVIRRIWSIR